MLDFDRLFGDLARSGIDLPRDPTESLLQGKLSGNAHGKHGKLDEWRRVLDNLPFIETEEVILDRDAVAAAASNIPVEKLAALREQLLALAPWRKGPFDLFGICIDAEWRSNLKWSRVVSAVSPLAGRRVLDVGCGNGYYAFRMKGQGADIVLGIDPTLSHIMQFQAVQKYLQQASVWALPCRLEELPGADRSFDTTFSMGVLYHQREPLDHLTRLRDTLRPGGELVLETLIVPGDGAECVVPESRYARMRNVWALPTIARLQQWLSEVRFSNCRVIDINETGLDEQRTTAWMPFESLDKALNPRDPAQTVEGLPRPVRAVIVGTRP
jgi:tRNA (mo5U34)-methyltransferase